MKPIGVSALVALGLSCPAAGAEVALRQQRIDPSRTHRSAQPISPRFVRMELAPRSLVLTGPDAAQTLLVTGRMGGGERLDLSLKATFRVADPRIARVSAGGILTPRRDGRTTVSASYGGKRVAATVRVLGAQEQPPVHFTNQLLPLLTKAGCNAGGCHGKASGQNGFRLSLLGYDPAGDYDAIVKDARGRRVSPAQPDESLLLAKATGAVAHGGGIRFTKRSPAYRLLRRWLAGGMPPGDPAAPKVAAIQVAPAQRTMRRGGERQRLVVTAIYTDGSCRDVTGEAQYVSNNDQVAVATGEGLVTTRGAAGDAAVMARYMGQVAVARFTVPLEEGKPVAAPPFPRRNFIDDLVAAKLKQLGVTPSAPCTDYEFIRRASLDATGILPSPEEVRAFVADPDPRRREKLVDRLLARPEHADFWAQKWADLLRNKTRSTEQKVGSWSFHYWIRDALAANVPYDQFARAILTAQGEPADNPPVNWYREVSDLPALVNDSAQIFLGVRLSCANCHHHPYEKWSQADYYGYAALFARVGRKDLGSGAQAVYVDPNGSAQHPLTGETMKPKPLDAPAVELGPFDDPRRQLVDWMVRPANPYFARALVNRLWRHYLGRGLVEPVDDLRVTNPPSNPALMEALARDFVRHGYDLRHLTRLIMTSGTYQLSATPRGNNRKDAQNYARAYARRLSAEVLLDAVNQVCGTSDKFANLPAGTRAIQLPDETVPSYFLDVFGRPQRESACDCERVTEGNMAQTLHLMNSAELDAKVRAEGGRAATLAATGKREPEMVEELYLWALSRPPRTTELATALEYLTAKKDRKVALEDLLWALINTNEFLFNH
jgi:hypothetical protein